MRTFLNVGALFLACWGWAGSAQAQVGLVISEFLAINSNTLHDDFGEASDYVELFNGTSTALNLQGYCLTDTLGNPAKWVFPATQLLPNHHLLVWASGRDRRIPGQPLHTNFKLDSGGEAVALIQPDQTTVVSQYVFGSQLLDQSQGLEAEFDSVRRVLAQGMPGRYFVPTDNSLGDTWTEPDFDDRNWRRGTNGFGFDVDLTSDFSPWIATDVGPLMQGASPPRSGLYLRLPFEVENLETLPNLALQVRYDDGFVAYLNGTEVARRGLGATAAHPFGIVSALVRSNDLAVEPEVFSSLILEQSLRLGTNVLAIHAFNRDPADGDFLIVPEVVSRQIHYSTNALRSFAVPSPGVANAGGSLGSSGRVDFSVKSRTFVDGFELTLSGIGPAALSEVRFTVDGTVPGANSFRYSGPLLVTNSLLLRARLFSPGFLPGSVQTEAYARLAPEMLTVSSDLPLILVQSFGAGKFNESVKKGCFLFVHETHRGRSSFTNAADLVFRAGLKIRGSSSAANPKYNWALDCWDEDDRALDLALLGMPPGSEWTFHAPYLTDTSLIADPLASAMSEAAGRYASRFRSAELYLNERASGQIQATIAPTNYFGVYNIFERIGIGPHRVAIDKPSDQDVEPPAVTGGYLLNIDRNIDGPQGLVAGGQSFNYIDPSHEVMTSPPRSAQRVYLTNYLNQFTAALESPGWTNPVTGYAPYIEAGSWIDFHLINVISVNGDGLGLSTYFYKPRHGPLTFGPVWDFDKAFAWADVRDDAPLAWEGGKGFFYYPWWGRLFLDPNFWQAYIDRFQELNAGPYGIPGLSALVDRLNDQVKESAVRDMARWKIPKRGGTQEGEIAYFKDWLSRRIRFVETNFVARPSILERAGSVQLGSTVAITAPPGATVYYTLDGRDPRAVHGGLGSNVFTYTSPITLTDETRLVARALDVNRKFNTGAQSGNPPLPSPWSGPVSARYFFDAPAAPGDLIVSELNYHPSSPTRAEAQVIAGLVAGDFEFIEVQNTSLHTVDFYRSRFTRGIEFDFSQGTIHALAPGGRLVLAKNPTAFALRYGARSNLAGAYRGALADRGRSLRIEDTDGLPLLECTYDDQWYPSASGLGFTLVRRDLTIPGDRRAGWRPSPRALGSPGQEDPAAPSWPQVVINEALANPDGTGNEAVELLNLGRESLDISGWYLTDNPRQPLKYRIPDRTVLLPGGYGLVNEKAFGGVAQGTNAFRLNRHGDEIWLFAADSAGALLGYCHGFKFGVSEANTSWGRFVTSDGREKFVPQATTTLGRENVEPRIGPVVFREIFYHPMDVFENGAFWDDDDNEFIELENMSDQAIALSEATSGLAWRVGGGVDFDFSGEEVLEAHRSVLLVPFDPVQNPARLAAWRLKWGASTTVPVRGPFRGKLANSGAELTLLKPGPVDLASRDVSYVVVDRVTYRDNAPWPGAADGGGASLERRDRRRFGDDPENWLAALPSPGRDPGAGNPPVITAHPTSQTVVGGSRVVLSVRIALGLSSPALFQWRREGVNVTGARSPELVLNPVRVSDAGLYSLVVVNQNGSVVSAAARLNVLRPATIVRDPEGRNLKPGSALTLTVTALGTGPLSFQWYFNGTPLPGAIHSTVSLTNVESSQTGAYTVLVTDSIGTSASRPALVNVLVRPTFISQPASQVALVGDSVELRVEVDGLAPLKYRWRKGGATLLGATNATLRFNTVQLSDAGSYGVVVTNLATGNLGTNSQVATLIVMNDADHDRVGDEWETQNGYSFSNPDDGNLDDDGDGQTTRQEFAAGTNPRDPLSYFRIDSIRRTDLGVELSFIARANRGCTVQYRDAVDSGDWQALKQITGREGELPSTVVDPILPGRKRWYRLVTPPRY